MDLKRVKFSINIKVLLHMNKSPQLGEQAAKYDIID